MWNICASAHLIKFWISPQFCLVFFFLTCFPSADGSPVITSAEQVVVSGQCHYLPCSASGQPVPTIRWQLNDDELTFLTMPLNVYIYPNGTLRICDGTPKQNGKFVCSAENPRGSAKRSYEMTFSTLQGKLIGYATMVRHHFTMSSFRSDCRNWNECEFVYMRVKCMRSIRCVHVFVCLLVYMCVCLCIIHYLKASTKPSLVGKKSQTQLLVFSRKLCFLMTELFEQTLGFDLMSSQKSISGYWENKPTKK